MADDVTTTTETVVPPVVAEPTVMAPEELPKPAVVKPTTPIDREYLAAVIRKQCGHSPDMAAQFATACPPEVAIPLEQAARSGDLATVHTLLAEITPK